MIETDRISELINKYKITPNQIYIIWLLHTNDHANIKRYIDVFGQFQKEEFKDLVNKGLLIHTNRDAQAYRTTDLVVTLDLTEHLIQIDPDDAYEEFFSLYPAHLLVNNTKIPAKTLKFDEEKAARERYKEIVSKNKFIHQKILSAVTKYREQNNGFATIKIDKFITGRYWEEIEKEENNGAKPRIY